MNPRSGNTDRVMANAAKIARKYKSGSRMKDLVREHHSQSGTIKRAILTQMSVEEYKKLVSLHNSKGRKGKKHKKHKKYERGGPPMLDRHPGQRARAGDVEELRRHYERIEAVLTEAVIRENYPVPAGHTKQGQVSGYVNALEADRMLAEAETAKKPQDAPG